jgi:hypothetical protein
MENKVIFNKGFGKRSFHLLVIIVCTDNDWFKCLIKPLYTPAARNFYNLGCPQVWLRIRVP